MPFESILPEPCVSAERIAEETSTRQYRWSRTANLFPVAVFLGGAAAQALTFLPLYRLLGNEAVVQALLPTAVAAWFLGARAGFCSGVLNALVDLLLLQMVRESGTPHLGHAWGAAVIVAAAGGAIGWISDLRNRLREQSLLLREEAAKRRRTEEELSSSEGRYRGLFESANDIVYTHDLEGNLLSLSPAVERILGYTLAEAKGLNFSQGVATEQIEQARAMTTRKQMNGGRTDYDVRVSAKDGRLVDLAIGSWIMQRPGEAPYVFGVARDVTMLKRAEESLAFERRLLGSLVDTIPDSVYFKDLQGRFTRVNAAMAADLGVAESEIIGKSDFDFLDAASARRAQLDEIEVIRTGRPVIAREERLLLADGRAVWKLATKLPLHDGEGRLAGTFGISIDVTARKQAEEALTANEERYRALFEANPQPMWVYDPETLRFLDVNEAALHHYGYTRDECLAMTLPDIRPTETVSALIEHLARIQPGESSTLTCRHRKKDGTEFLVEVAGNDVSLRGRRARLVQATDVTEREKARASLNDHQALLHNIIENIPCAVFWKDRHSVYLGGNRLCARNLGIEATEDMVGKTDSDLCADETEAESYRKCDQEVMSTGRPLFNFEETLLGPGGQRKVLLTSKVLLRDARGEVNGLLGVYTDITERKKLEEQLRQGQKMEAVGKLAGGVAHDFNNLLTVINGFAEIVLEGLAADDPVQEPLMQIVKAGERAAALTRQLLAFSRKQIVAPKVLDLNAVVAEMGKMLQRVIGEDVELVMDLQPALEPIKIDPGHVEQMLMNLAVNARDAMPNGGRLTVSTRETLLLGEASDPDVRPGVYVVLTVKDTGCGMTAEVRSHAFEPFFTTKGVGEGTGLGLATVYGVVRQAAGRVELESAPAEGATFRIYLPCCAPPMMVDSPEAGLRPPKGGRETILVVEDERAVRNLVCSVLKSHGYMVLAAASGAEALKVCEEHPAAIELLVTDVVMPGGLGGQKLAHRLLEQRPDLRALFMSGYTDDAVLRNGVSQDEVHFLQKPFAPTALALKVREILDATTARPSAEFRR